MRETLFIHLESAAGPEQPLATWLHSGAASERGALDAAVAAAAGRRIVVFVPGTDVMLAQAKVPSRNRQRIAQTLPYLLEEQLATDIDRLHIAVGTRAPDGTVSAAVVERAQMEDWLETLHAAGLEPDVLTPDILALPWEEGAWTIMVDGELTRVRAGRHAGFAVDSANLEVMLKRALLEADAAKPARAIVYDDTGASGAALFAELEIEPEYRPRPETLLVLAAQGYTDGDAVNLLQGGYSRREQLSRLWRPWIPSAALLGALVLVNAGILVGDYLRLSRSQDNLNAEIESIYRAAFPDARRVVNAKVQMERGLQALRGGAGPGGDFLDLMQNAGVQLQQAGGVVLQRIHYRDGKLDLALVIDDLQGLDRLKQQLTERGGLAVEIQSATARDGKVEARLQLAKASS